MADKSSLKINNTKEIIKKYLFILSFLVVPLFLLICFTILPVIGVTFVGFFYWDGISDMEFVAFKNFVKVFSDTTYLDAFINSLYYLVAAIIQLVLSIILAVVITFLPMFKNFFKGIVFFPYLINCVAAGYMFYLFFEPSLGTLNSIIQILGFSKTEYWLENREINNILLSIVSIWKYIGFNFVMFCGVIVSVSPELYEAADLDGATQYDKWKYIILPNIKKVIFLNMILAIKGAISVFEIPYIILQGGFGTSTLAIEAYITAFSKRPNVGLASAISTVLLIIVIVVTIIQKLFFREENEN